MVAPCWYHQRSVLGPLLFLLFINDFTHVVSHCNIWLFADDTCLFIEVDNGEETAKLINQDLKHIQHWANKWLVTFSAPQTKSLIISNKKDFNLSPSVWLNEHKVKEVPDHNIYIPRTKMFTQP